MQESSQKKEYRSIPTEINEEEFKKFILPHLRLPKRGPKCKIGYRAVFNFIIWVLYTGAQWKMIPIPKDENGKPIIHYTQIYRNFARWSDDGSLEQAFIASVKYLLDEKKLDLSVLHGDGTNTIAKKGAILLAILGINTKLEKRLLRSLIIMAMSLLRWPQPLLMNQISYYCIQVSSN